MATVRVPQRLFVTSVVLVLCVLAACAAPSCAGGTTMSGSAGSLCPVLGRWALIYNSNVAHFADWQTNSPANFYFDPVRGAYHYAVTDATDEYALVPVPYCGGSFLLEFDWKPVSTDPNSNHAFGMWSAGMSTIIGESSSISMNGRYLTGANETGLFLDVIAFDDAGTPGYLVPRSMRGLFEDGASYHVTIFYDRAAAKVYLLGMSICPWRVVSYEVLVGNGQSFGVFTLDRLAFTSIGDYGYPGMTAEGYVKNVKLFERTGR